MGELRFDDGGSAGRVVVITGAGRGLGRAHALLLGRLGARIVVNDNGGSMNGEGIDEGPAAEVVAEIRAAGGEAIANIDSVATPDGAAAIVGAALTAWGRVDALIHNAGNVRYGSIRDISYADFQAVIDVHLMGAFNVVKAAFGPMLDARYGRIVLTSSIGGIYGNLNCVNYGIAKSGMIGLNNVAALEGEAHDVKCNIIVPSAVTRMAEGIDISQYPPMDPELVAPVVAWLAHEGCTLSGEMIGAIAGRVARMFIAETEGVYRAEWSIDDVAGRIDAICDKRTLHDFGLHGHVGHISHSFAMARQGMAD